MNGGGKRRCVRLGQCGQYAQRLLSKCAKVSKPKEKKGVFYCTFARRSKECAKTASKYALFCAFSQGLVKLVGRRQEVSEHLHLHLHLHLHAPYGCGHGHQED